MDHLYEKFEESKDESAFELEFTEVKQRSAKPQDLEEY